MLPGQHTNHHHHQRKERQLTYWNRLLLNTVRAVRDREAEQIAAFGYCERYSSSSGNTFIEPRIALSEGESEVSEVDEANPVEDQQQQVRVCSLDGLPETSTASTETVAETATQTEPETVTDSVTETETATEAVTEAATGAATEAATETATKAATETATETANETANETATDRASPEPPRTSEGVMVVTYDYLRRLWNHDQTRAGSTAPVIGGTIDANGFYEYMRFLTNPRGQSDDNERDEVSSHDTDDTTSDSEESASSSDDESVLTSRRNQRPQARTTEPFTSIQSNNSNNFPTNNNNSTDDTE